MRIVVLIVFCCTLQWAGAQVVKENFKVEKTNEGKYYYATGLSLGYGTEKSLPFWMQANKFGLVPSENYGLWDFEISKKQDTSKEFDWTFGVMAAASVADRAAIRFRDYYVGGHYRGISVFVGAKADAVRYDGLSSTNGNFIWSSNARPYPRISVEIPYTEVPFTKGILKFKGFFSEGIMYDNRYVDKPHVHHKNLYLKAEKGRFSVEFGLNHYAQWGGESPRFGNLPTGLGVYRDMFFALDNSDYDQIAVSFDKNRVGNHLGMLDGRFHYKGDTFSFDFYRQIIFEDHSGQNFFNRDALHGIYIKRTEEKAWVQSFLLEHYYTKKQSGEKTGKKPGEDKLYTGQDNYFNQGIYRSGWTSYGYTIGVPFFTPIQGTDYALGVSNNRIEALHGGIFGFIFGKYPYKVMCSYSNNIGTYSHPIDKNQLSAYFDMTIPFQIQRIPFKFIFGATTDQGQYFKDNLGFFAKITTNGWWK